MLHALLGEAQQQRCVNTTVDIKGTCQVFS